MEEFSPAALDEDKVLMVLPLILQNSHSNVQLLCTLLTVSKSCREAIHHSGVQQDVCLTIHQNTAASCGAWLAQHAGLVSELTLDCRQSVPDHQDDWIEDAFGQLFAQALQLCKLSKAVPAAGGTFPQKSTAVCAQPTAGATALRLPSLSLIGISLSSILQAIQPSDSLTFLHLNGQQPHFTGGALAALRSLKGLRCLELVKDRDSSEQLPLQIYDAASNMLHLTRLLVKGAQVSDAALQQLPLSLQVLVLHGEVAPQPPSSPPQKLSLQHLVDVKVLSWCWPKQDHTVHLTLPQQLTRLELAGSVQAELPSGVLCASIIHPEVCMHVVEQLPVLRGLQELLLGYCFHEVGPVGVSELQAQQAQHVAAVLGSLQRLTCLQIDSSDWEEGWSAEMQLGATVQQLQALKHLVLEHAELTEADAVRLSCLTDLTHLALTDAGAGVTGLAVAALACQLTGLKWLDVSGCGLQCRDVLPVLGRLTSLRRLSLHGNSLSVDAVGLFMLTGLKELTALSIPCQHSVSDGAMVSFLSAFPGLHEVGDGIDPKA